MLTPADKEALCRMPEGWFRPRDLPFMVRSPDYRCKRLEAAGVLVSRIVGTFPDVWREYAKPPNV